MPHASLREFLYELERRGQLQRVGLEVSPQLEMTELCRRSLVSNGPALLFERPRGCSMPVLGNLFGTTARVAAALGRDDVSELREVGAALAFLKEPQWPDRLSAVLERLPAFAPLLKASPRIVATPPCREVVHCGTDVDITRLPIWTCWPEDAGPLITWGLVITRGVRHARQNVAVYRQQVLGRNRVIMRWLPHRGGALDYRGFRERHPNEPFPVVVALGADPALLLSAAAPIPDTISEFQFAGLLRGRRSEVWST